MPVLSNAQPAAVRFEPGRHGASLILHAQHRGGNFGARSHSEAQPHFHRPHARQEASFSTHSTQMERLWCICKGFPASGWECGPST